LTQDFLAKLIEHNNWANQQVIRACSALDEDQLDATPLSPAQWSIRQNLVHLVECQEGYLSLLTLPPEKRNSPSVPFDVLEESARSSGQELLAIAQGKVASQLAGQVRTLDGYRAEPWVVMVQAVNHGAEHRKQIAGLLRALGVDPPGLDGWSFGEATDALVRTTG
jgi:uncharacterized damage-inducible protein DinB